MSQNIPVTAKMTSTIDRGVRSFCPECGANVRTEANRCWLCLRPLPPIEDSLPADAISLPTAPSKPGSGHGTQPSETTAQFSLATILLVITLIAVCFGVFRISPGLGVIVAAIATPALFATVIVAENVMVKRGQRLTFANKIVAFVGFFGVFSLLAAAMFGALMTSCGILATGMEGQPRTAGLLVAGGAALFVFAVSTLAVLARVLGVGNKRLE